MTARPKKRSIHAQIEEVEREIALRRRVYPGFVARGKMRQTEADEHIVRLSCALATLLWVRDNADDLRRRAVEAEKETP